MPLAYNTFLAISSSKLPTSRCTASRAWLKILSYRRCQVSVSVVPSSAGMLSHVCLCLCVTGLWRCRSAGGWASGTGFGCVSCPSRSWRRFTCRRSSNRHRLVSHMSTCRLWRVIFNSLLINYIITILIKIQICWILLIAFSPGDTFTAYFKT